jgi:hypothetical protein
LLVVFIVVSMLLVSGGPWGFGVSMGQRMTSTGECVKLLYS